MSDRIATENMRLRAALGEIGMCHKDVDDETHLSEECARLAEAGARGMMRDMTVQDVLNGSGRVVEPKTQGR